MRFKVAYWRVKLKMLGWLPFTIERRFSRVLDGLSGMVTYHWAIIPTLQFYMNGEQMGRELDRYMKKYVINTIIIKVGEFTRAKIVEIRNK